MCTIHLTWSLRYSCSLFSPSLLSSLFTRGTFFIASQRMPTASVISSSITCSPSFYSVHSFVYLSSASFLFFLFSFLLLYLSHLSRSTCFSFRSPLHSAQPAQFTFLSSSDNKLLHIWRSTCEWLSFPLIESVPNHERERERKVSMATHHAFPVCVFLSPSLCAWCSVVLQMPLLLRTRITSSFINVVTSLTVDIQVCTILGLKWETLK